MDVYMSTLSALGSSIFFLWGISMGNTDLSIQTYQYRSINTDLSIQTYQYRPINTDLSTQIYQYRSINTDLSTQIYQYRSINTDLSIQIYQHRPINTDLSIQIYQHRPINTVLSVQFYPSGSSCLLLTFWKPPQCLDVGKVGIAFMEHDHDFSALTSIFSSVIIRS